MEPIELNGKVFCSNCGLTVAAAPTPKVDANPKPSEPIEETETEKIETPEVNEESVVEETPLLDTASEEDQFAGLTIDKLASDQGIITNIPTGIKLEVKTEEPGPKPEPLNPITEEVKKDLGIVTDEPVFESKIGGLSIPSEEDFSVAPIEEEAVDSHIELPNPGDEKTALEASGILLDILGQSQPQQLPEKKTPTPTLPSDVVSVPELDTEAVEDEDVTSLSENDKTDIASSDDDDIYTLPSEIKVGFSNKKVIKEAQLEEAKVATEADLKAEITDNTNEIKNETEEALLNDTDQTEVKKIEQEIAEAPEPIVALTSEEAENYDPDTIEAEAVVTNPDKAKMIKEYFSTAIEKDKKALKEKAETKKKKRAGKIIGISLLLTISLIAFTIFCIYFAYPYYKNHLQQNLVKNTQETTNSNANSNSVSLPEYTPTNYVLTTSSYINSDQTFEVNYTDKNDSTKTISYRQIKTDNPTEDIAAYLSDNSLDSSVKKLDGITYTETTQPSLIWAKDGYVFIIATSNYTLSTDLLYQMAESINS